MMLMLPLTPLVGWNGWSPGSSFGAPDERREHSRAYVPLHSLRLLLFCPGYVGAPTFRPHKGRVTNALRFVLEAVADTPHGLDPGLLQLGGGELSAEAGHVDVDRPGLDEAVAAPDHVEQLFTAEDPARSPDQSRQQLELLGGEFDLSALHPDLETVAVDLQVAGLEVGSLFLGVGRPAAAEHRPDPGD